jgi:hypothetical protein
MNLVNLTPHNINLRTAEGAEIVIPASGTVARVATTPGTLTSIEGCPVPVATPTVFGAVEGLPAPTEGTLFIVSALVAGRCAGRPDVVSPGTGPNDGAVRNEKGHIVAVTRLIQAGA